MKSELAKESSTIQDHQPPDHTVGLQLERLSRRHPSVPHDWSANLCRTGKT